MNVVDIKIADLKPYAKNAKQHPQAQIDLLASNIERFGFTTPILIGEDNEVIAGHGRLLALKQLGATEAPVVRMEGLTADEVKALRLADNKISELGEWDMSLVIEELKELDPALFDLTGFDAQLLHPSADGSSKGSLQDRFIVPPFSILDTRKGYWQDRKREWMTRMPNIEESREDTLYKASESEIGKKMTDIGTTSHFDPVLAEIVYTWFAPKGGRVLDPFAGEQTKGVVAGELGFGYTGVEFRKEQVEVNNETCKQYGGVVYHVGDSNDLNKIVKDSNYDLVFTSPPYFDLEVYSKEDASALGTYTEFMQHYRNIFAQAVAKLANDRFLVVKVGEIRDKKSGAYRNFVGDNIQVFTELGLHYYNEIILINPAGTLPFRAARSLNHGRKVGKVHQNILVFYKGDPRKINDTFGEVISEAEAEEISDVDTTNDPLI